MSEHLILSCFSLANQSSQLLWVLIYTFLQKNHESSEQGGVTRSSILPALYQGQASPPVSLAGDHPAPARTLSLKSVLDLLYGPECPWYTPSNSNFCQGRARESQVIYTMLSAGLFFLESVMAFQSLNPMDGCTGSLIGNVLELVEVSSKLAGAHLLSVSFQTNCYCRTCIWDQN